MAPPSYDGLETVLLGHKYGALSSRKLWEFMGFVVIKNRLGIELIEKNNGEPKNILIKGNFQIFVQTIF